MIQAVDTLAPIIGITAACEAVGLPRGSFYRAQPPAEPVAPSPALVHL